MDFGIKGKTAVITGSGKGIGKAIAASLAAEGCNVVITDIDKKLIDLTVKEIKRSSECCVGYELDVTRSESVEKVFAQVREVFGSVDILVNNAGIVEQANTAELTKEEFDRVFQVNYLGAMYCCQEVMEQMREKNWGRIVNICSLAIKMIGRTNVASYAVSKAALGALTKVLAKDLGPSNVTVNAVLPGTIALTDFNDAVGYPKSTDLLPGMDIPVGRRGTPADIAPAVAFLCSQQAAYITGEFLDINGGLCMD